MRTIGKTFIFALLLAGLTVAGATVGTDADTPLFNTIKAFRYEPQPDGVRVVLETGYPVLNYTHYDSDPETYAVDLPDVVLGEGVPAILAVNGTNVADARLVEVSRTRSRSLYRLEIHKAYLATAQVSAKDGLVSVLVTGGVLADQEPRPSTVAATVAPAPAKPVVSTPAVQPVATAEPASGPAQRLRGIRMEGAGSVAVELDGTAKFNHFALTGPDRIVLDIHGITATKLADLPSGGAVTRIRVSQYQTSPEKITRIVFDMARAVKYNIARDGRTVRVQFGDGASTELVSAPPAPEQPRTADLAANSDIPALPASVAEPGAVPAVQTAAAPVATTPTAPVAFNDARPILYEGAPADKAASGSGETVLGGVPMSFKDKTISGDAGKYTGDLISIDFNNMDIRDILRFFADISNLNFVVNPTVRANVTIRLRDVPWDQALEVILRNHGYDYIYENNVVWVAKTSDIVKKIAERNALEDARQQAEIPETLVIRVGYAPVKEVEKAFKEMIKNDKGGGKTKKNQPNIVLDARTNSIIVEDVPSRLRKFQEMARLLDTPTPQILVEARFVEAQSSWSQSIGIQWGTTGNGGPASNNANDETPNNFPANYNGVIGYGGPPAISQAASGFTFALELLNRTGSFGLDIALNAFESQGKVRVISAPRLVTQNNNPAKIDVGTTIYVGTGVSTALGLTAVNATLTLDVTPQVTADGYVVMDVKLSNSSPSNDTFGGDVAVNTRQIDTVLRVKDGGTAVIGGVFQSTEDIGMNGVPFLSKIPVLGWLFKSRSKNRNNTELIVFLTPKVIP